MTRHSSLSNLVYNAHRAQFDSPIRRLFNTCSTLLDPVTAK